MAQGTMTTGAVATGEYAVVRPAGGQLRANLLVMLLVTLLAGAVRLWLVAPAPFPLNDGGFVFAATDALIANGGLLPEFLPYNNETALPYAAPPAAFYLLAALHRLTGLPVIDLMRWTPAALATLAVPLAYMLGLSYFRSARLGLLTALAFAAAPSTIYNVVTGGGVPAALGTVFSVAALWQAIWLVREEENWHLPTAALFAAVALMSDLRWGAFTLLSMVVLFTSGDRSLKATAQLAGLLATTAVLTAPWVFLVVRAHTAVPFFDVLFDVWSTYNPLGPLVEPNGTLTLESAFATLNVMAILGVFVALACGRFNVVIWLAATLLLLPDGTQSVTVVPIAIATALALDYLLMIGLASFSPTAATRRGGISVVGVAAVATILFFPVMRPLYGEFVIGDAALTPLTDAQRAAMATVASDFPPEASVALLTTNNDPFADAVTAWFPVLTGRRSANTLQGTEWLNETTLRGEIRAYDELQACITQRVACIETWRLNHEPFTHLWLSPRAQGLLRASIVTNTSYELVYDADGILIYARR